MRAFLALNLNDEIKNKYSNILRINENIAELKKVSKDKMHITLVFFDNIEEEQIELIKKEVINSSPTPFNINLENISYFINKFKDINVIFVKAVSDKLKDYVTSLRNNLDNIENLKYDKKDFKSHITLARVKKVYNNEKLKENIEQIDFTALSFIANSITLYKSDFVNYTEIFTINF
ncbi:RNA 2',3'-cyclic phosphodiesterase [Brachyspira hyodysenteriae]|uniref:RNA 2',3'-cyclic phosphodiesterase n=1 Tax=Brachyspira hyodysenteriae TaxID=159 RepID=UPI0022CD2B6F|nr:RNA 2',3'-cyclic phosphodiesterase [Brachyspira hyodysenteriae]MCZ9838908.1 RNA 2',3'-cyclic phosphodiesterase [Brachyspira hyodysenteriae]MCZ9848196.1 RNA 2',3'-cyclic phosphodiesterase [Brachyspira hyodysenteriae]MCZ9851756.1 RNA 2',3'-cyclic phosphodiesterase [Brachyspira hyodysenteriae]MCZ9859506.1 RNA 2',3'-cyclic phosphodiesterase [Brachyspira hyodysenteriae]MCZ9870110.1 RNA 2',3'-cyclic phosphodiesterase [Brachyspira hyodysenteriae]